MKKLILIVLLLSITSCGPSAKDLEALAKKNLDIATVTCNIISESPTYDAAMRIKEVNLAREKIGEDLFLGKDNEIAESLFYGLCEELVLNDTEYSNKLNEQILIAVQLRLKEEQEAEQLRLKEEQEAEELRLKKEQEAEELRLKQIAEDKELAIRLANEYIQNNKLTLEKALGKLLSEQEWSNILKNKLYDLSLEFNKRAYIEIIIDNETVKSGLFSKGESFNLQIVEPSSLTVSDSFALTGTYQGKNIDLITGSDALGVNTIVLNPEHNFIKSDFLSSSDFDLFVLRAHVLSSLENAETISDSIKKGGYPSFIEPFGASGDLHAVYVGPFLTEKEIKDNLKEIQNISESSQSIPIRWEL